MLEARPIQLLLRPRDPLIFRDGRPFDSSLLTRMTVHPWPPPSVTAGAIRTALYRQSSSTLTSAELNRLDIAGALPLEVAQKQFYLPAPQDCLSFSLPNDTTRRRVHVLRPPKTPNMSEGCNLPEGLMPLFSHPNLNEKIKSTPPAWWPLNKMAHWLSKSLPDDSYDPDFRQCLPAFPIEERTHVKLNAQTLASERGLLFSTCGIDFRQKETAEPFALAFCLNDPKNEFNAHIEALHEQFIPLGGERRLVQVATDKNTSLWQCPPSIKKALQARPKFIRMVLATPAIFKAGWRPDWLAPNNCGSVPGTEVQVKLMAAAIPRYQSVSGWSHGKNGPQPKATRKMVPAGSVYFFELDDPSRATELEALWLRPICGRSVLEPGCGLGADGFGLALWGIW
ncbi:MAG: type III-B CRISPR module-associated protein Cmr3 [Cystobacterineae bacterium]|nr:type III-B CRISPR module-associated protein Cmr3 [Cystobacterineae bacterium]